MMSKSRNRIFSRNGAKTQSLRSLCVFLCAFAPLREKLFPTLLLLLVALATGCRRDMQDQPKIKPLRGTTFFTDRLGTRRPIEGTVPRGYLRSDTEYFTGKKAGATGATATPADQQIAGQQSTGAQTVGAQASSFPDDIDIFPLPVTQEVIERGH